MKILYSTTSNKVFFLAGTDLEMATIISTLTDVGARAFYASAKASAYAEELATLPEGSVAVLVGLEVDCDLPAGTIVINNHGSRTGDAASILQVLDLLELKPTRWHQLVAAHHTHYLQGLFDVNASKEEIAQIMSSARACSGITPEQEEQAAEAYRNGTIHGTLEMYRMPTAKCAALTDLRQLETD